MEHGALAVHKTFLLQTLSSFCSSHFSASLVLASEQEAFELVSLTSFLAQQTNSAAFLETKLLLFFVSFS